MLLAFYWNFLPSIGRKEQSSAIISFGLSWAAKTQMLSHYRPQLWSWQFWFLLLDVWVWFQDIKHHRHANHSTVVIVWSLSHVNSLWPHGLQHSRLPCPSLSPGVCSSSCPLSWWCHPTISSSVVPFSSCPQSFPAPRSFPISQLFTLGGQSIGASASLLPMNIQDWFPLELSGLTSLLSKGLSRVFSSSTIQKHRFLNARPSLRPNSYLCMTTGKTIALSIQTFVSKVCLLCKTLSRFVTAFLLRIKCLLISW